MSEPSTVTPPPANDEAARRVDVEALSRLVDTLSDRLAENERRLDALERERAHPAEARRGVEP